MPGNDLLSRLSSTIGAGTFHGRVRDGIEWGRSAIITRQTKDVFRHIQCAYQNDLSCLLVISLIRVSIANESDKADRTISTGKLHALLRFHTRPINVVVFHGSRGRTCFEASFPLRCLQRLSLPHIATLHCGWRHNRSTRGASIPVLSY
jgi:hypothetical protein